MSIPYNDFGTELLGYLGFYNDFETLTSECANVSHIWLPERARSRGYLSLCLVFCNEFDTFAKKLTTVAHLGDQAIRIP